jgi:hypothetical protein
MDINTGFAVIIQMTTITMEVPGTPSYYTATAAIIDGQSREVNITV